MKKYSLLLLLILFIASCSKSKFVEVSALHKILKQYNVEGSVLIFDAEADLYKGINFERCDSGFLPASTYKIPNTIIGLETGVVSDSGVQFIWNGEKRFLSAWENDLTLREAFHLSCVPCYQEVARKIGTERMNLFLSDFSYGNMDVGEENIDLFWLRGESKISQLEQIEFLEKLYEGKLPVSQSTMQKVKELMLIEQTENYKLSGKTGWAIRGGNNIGWFVGWLETGNNVYYIATNIHPSDNNVISDFSIARKKITMKSLREMGIIEQGDGQEE